MPSRETFAYRRALKLRAQRAVEDSGNDSAVDNVFSRAQNDFATFCTLMDKPPAQHMLQWHRELVTGESNRYLLDIAGPNTDILERKRLRKKYLPEFVYCLVYWSSHSCTEAAADNLCFI